MLGPPIIADHLLPGCYFCAPLPPLLCRPVSFYAEMQPCDPLLLLAGGLPSGWLSPNRVFRQLRLLDLSNNLLGTSNGSAPYPTSEGGWCTGGGGSGSSSGNATTPGGVGGDPGAGWCPTGAPLANTFPSLEMLDLSSNQLAGGWVEAGSVTGLWLGVWQGRPRLKRRC